MLIVAAVNETLAAGSIYVPGSPELARFESDIARFLGREWARVAADPKPIPFVGDQGPIWCEPPFA
jgi:hypothetical protein